MNRFEPDNCRDFAIVLGALVGLVCGIPAQALVRPLESLGYYDINEKVATTLFLVVGAAAWAGAVVTLEWVFKKALRSDRPTLLQLCRPKSTAR